MSATNTKTQMHVNRIGDDVVVTFSEPVSWLKLTPVQAGAVAKLLQACAENVTPDTPH